MKLYRQMLSMSAALAVCATTSVFSQTANPLSELQAQVDGFSDKLAQSLPFNATLGLNWSDAYIGQLIGIPPHFGVGVSGGVTTMDLGYLTKLTDLFGVSLDLPIDRMIMPGYTVEGRIGGFFLPFDVGLKFGVLPQMNFTENITFDYTLVGGDIRYALLKGPILPNVSLGVGLHYLRGGIGTVIQGAGTSFTFNSPSPHTLKLSDPELAFSWETTTLDFKAQISKSLFIVTPYLGLGVSHGWSKAGYTVDSDLTYDGTTVDGSTIEGLKDALALAGIGGIAIDEQGFSSILEKNGWGFRVFGGLSFNLLVIRLDLTGMYSFLDSNFGGSFGVRFQL
ncbi:MAG: hypothetical protein LBQ30_07425 [Treponema sp.]|jgi:hypothetical protein|nr:hypothetical protein [Treponema sp.]